VAKIRGRRRGLALHEPKNIRLGGVAGGGANAPHPKPVFYQMQNRGT